MWDTTKQALRTGVRALELNVFCSQSLIGTGNIGLLISLFFSSSFAEPATRGFPSSHSTKQLTRGGEVNLPTVNKKIADIIIPSTIDCEERAYVVQKLQITTKMDQIGA